MAVNVEQIDGFDVFRYHQYIPQNEATLLKSFRAKKLSIEASLSQTLLDHGIVSLELVFSFTTDVNDTIFNCSFESINKRIDPMAVRLLEEQLDKISQALASAEIQFSPLVGANQKRSLEIATDEMNISEFNYLGGTINCSANHIQLKTAANELILQPTRENIIKLIYLASKTLTSSDHNVDIADVFQCVTKRLLPLAGTDCDAVILNNTIEGTY